MNKKILILLVAIGILSCNYNEKFTISGTIENAPKTSKIYLEHVGLQQITTLDSTTVKKDGTFQFAANAPEYADLYRLRMDGKNFIFTIDSTEHIVVNTSAEEFSLPQEIENSYKTEEITELRKAVIELQKTYRSFKDKEISKAEMLAKINGHKKKVRKLILSDTRSMSAYFALFQQIDGMFIFSVELPEDRPYFSAVATAFHTFMSDYERSKSIYSITLTSINREREAQQDAYFQRLVAESELGIIDIELPNQFGNMRKLSDLDNKVVLLDFSAYEAKSQIEYTFALRELYDKFSNRDFEIYQVSVDSNKLLWEQATEKLPWICVHDPQSIYSIYLSSYNVQNLPTTFLIDRSGTVIGRNISFEKLPSEIEKCLRKKK